jgi:hypothetical protein
MIKTNINIIAKLFPSIVIFMRDYNKLMIAFEAMNNARDMRTLPKTTSSWYGAN